MHHIAPPVWDAASLITSDLAGVEAKACWLERITDAERNRRQSWVGSTTDHTAGLTSTYRSGVLRRHKSAEKERRCDCC